MKDEYDFSKAERGKFHRPGYQQRGPTVPQPMMMLPSSDKGPLVTHVQQLRPLSDLVLSQSTLDPLERVVLEHRHADALTSKGLRPSHRMLFCGPPGTGKTIAAGGVAASLGMPLMSVRLDTVIASFMGASSANLRLVFEMARTQRVVLFFDEVDALGAARAGGKEDTGEAKRIVNSFLVMLEESPCTSLVIAATNHEGVLDPALWRRFDEIVVFPDPTSAQRVSLLNHLLYRCNILPRDSRWGARLAGMSYADVERVAFDAMKTLAIDEHLNIERTLLDAVQRQKHRRALTGAKR